MEILKDATSNLIGWTNDWLNSFHVRYGHNYQKNKQVGDSKLNLLKGERLVQVNGQPGPNSVRGSIEPTTILTTHPSLANYRLSWNTVWKISILHSNISKLCPFMLKLLWNLCNFDPMYDIWCKHGILHGSFSSELESQNQMCSWHWLSRLQVWPWV